MSGTSFGPVTPTSGQLPVVPQGYLGQGNLLQTNTTLLQPIPGSFRLFETLWLLMMGTLSATPLITPLEETVRDLSTDTASADVSLQDQISALQAQVDMLNARLGRAGIAE